MIKTNQTSYPMIITFKIILILTLALGCEKADEHDSKKAVGSDSEKNMTEGRPVRSPETVVKAETSLKDISSLFDSVQEVNDRSRVCMTRVRGFAELLIRIVNQLISEAGSKVRLVRAVVDRYYPGEPYNYDAINTFRDKYVNAFIARFDQEVQKEIRPLQAEVQNLLDRSVKVRIKAQGLLEEVSSLSQRKSSTRDEYEGLLRKRIAIEAELSQLLDQIEEAKAGAYLAGGKLREVMPRIQEAVFADAEKAKVNN